MDKPEHGRMRFATYCEIHVCASDLCGCAQPQTNPRLTLEVFNTCGHWTWLDGKFCTACGKPLDYQMPPRDLIECVMEGDRIAIPKDARAPSSRC